MSDATPGLFGMFQITAVALALCGCLSISPASAQAPDGCYPIPAVVAPNYSQPPNLDFIKKQLLYYRCSQYDADIAAVLDEAQRWVRMRAPQVANPAIVLDIDETSLSNWKRIYRDDFAYIDKGACPLDKGVSRAVTRHGRRASKPLQSGRRVISTISRDVPTSRRHVKRPKCFSSPDDTRTIPKSATRRRENGPWEISRRPDTMV
jgi:hypothetical protein